MEHNRPLAPEHKQLCPLQSTTKRHRAAERPSCCRNDQLVWQEKHKGCIGGEAALLSNLNGRPIARPGPSQSTRPPSGEKQESARDTPSDREEDQDSQLSGTSSDGNRDKCCGGSRLPYSLQPAPWESGTVPWQPPDYHCSQRRLLLITTGCTIA